jgi:ferredoxin
MVTAATGNARITVDRDRCVGSGQCVLAEPALFDQDDEGLVVLRESVPGADRLTTAHEAAGLCPAAAINFHED